MKSQWIYFVTSHSEWSCAATEEAFMLYRLPSRILPSLLPVRQGAESTTHLFCHHWTGARLLQFRWVYYYQLTWLYCYPVSHDPRCNKHTLVLNCLVSGSLVYYSCEFDLLSVVYNLCILHCFLRAPWWALENNNFLCIVHSLWLYCFNNMMCVMPLNCVGFGLNV